jgi:hypothetical protein
MKPPYNTPIRTIVIALMTAVLSGGCERASVAPAAERDCIDDSLADMFFPQDAFVPKLIDVDDELREALARYLQAAHEPPWICGRVPSEGYRLFIGGGFGLPALVASAARTSSGWRLAFSEFQRLQPGTAYVVAKRAENETGSIPSQEIRQALQHASFWSGPTWQQIEAEGDIVMIEVVDGADHRAVIQAVPTAEFRTSALLLLRMITGSENFLRLRTRSR